MSAAERKALEAAREALAICYNVWEWPADGTTSKDAALVLIDAALSAQQVGAEAVVKPLEWQKRHESEYVSRAETIIGVYRVWSHHEANGEWYWSVDVLTTHTVSDEEAAKAAAQADYERRILSALASPPASVTEAGSPVAWLDDGTLRAGSERTAYRVVTDEQKRDMPSAVRRSFNTPLYARPAPVDGAVEALRAAALRLLSEIDAPGDINAIVGASNPLRVALRTTGPSDPASVSVDPEWDGLDCSCGGGWKVGHAFGCPEDAAETEQSGVTEAMVDAAQEEFRKRGYVGANEVALRAALTAAIGSPSGWRLVPEEPTDGMIEAGQETLEEKNSWGGRAYASDVWQAMLKATPSAPEGGE